MRTSRRFLALACQPLVHDAIKVPLHCYHFSLARRIEGALGIEVLSAVVSRATLWIAQHLIRAVNSNEARGGIGRRGNVGVVLAREPSISRLDFVSGRARSESENTVEVRHGFSINP